MSKAYRILGTTNDVTECELCGRVELKGTVALMPIDADGADEGDAVYFGTSCAAKAAGWTVRQVNAGVKAVAAAKLAEERAATIQAREDENRAYKAWVAETYGAGLKDAVQKHGVAGMWELFRAAQAVPEVAEGPAPVAEPVLPTPVDPGPFLTKARRMAALAGIGPDDELYAELRKYPTDGPGERRRVTGMVWSRTRGVPGGYEEWLTRLRAAGL